LDADTGQCIWKSPVIAPTSGTAKIGYSSPAIAHNRAYIGLSAKQPDFPITIGQQRLRRDAAGVRTGRGLGWISPLQRALGRPGTIDCVEDAVQTADIGDVVVDRWRGRETVRSTATGRTSRNNEVEIDVQRRLDGRRRQHRLVRLPREVFRVEPV